MIINRLFTIMLPIWMAGFIILMITVPRMVEIPDAENIVSASNASGYFAPTAYLVTLLWSLVIVGASLLMARMSDAHPASEGAPWVPGRIRPLELLVVFALFGIAYFPTFPTRYGPLTESFAEIAGAFRMMCGQLPYEDFERLYGPLLANSVAGWMNIFGASMHSYFGFTAVQEAVQFTILMAVIQIFVPDRKTRWIAFALISIFMLNVLLGVNWSAARRLLAVFAILLAASRPFSIPVNVIVGVIVGIHATYSHEYAGAGLLGIGAIYGVLLLGPDWRRSLTSGPIVAVVALIVWAVVARALTGETWHAYLDSMTRVVGMMSLGHVSFAFSWSINALALYALLTLACVMAGAALPRFRSGGAQTGDLFFIGALVFALIVLKSGLNRADVWHLDAAFAALIPAFLLRMPSRIIPHSPATHRLSFALICIAAVTYLAGSYPAIRSYAGAYANGARDVLTGVEPADTSAYPLRGPATETERSYPRAELLELGAYLARPENIDLPVLYYGSNWLVSPLIGACPQDFKLDALMYSEFDRPERDFLIANPGTIVVMSVEDYERLYEGAPVPQGDDLDTTRKVLSWVASPHYTQGWLEANLLNAARDRVTGAWLLENYDFVERFGRSVILRPRG